MGIELYVGGYGATIQGDVFTLDGKRCFSAAHRYRPGQALGNVTALLDSGAFTDPPAARLDPEQALARQLHWEANARQKAGLPDWQAEALVSYDRLIDEVWVGGERIKRRWGLAEAEFAVEETITAAWYLASQRERLTPRRLVLSCQGVDSLQYRECAAEVLRVADPDDWIGLGGWCILGRWRSWMPEFWRTCRAVLPMIAAAGVKRVHIFGVLYQPALGGLLWLADRYGLDVSTDSSGPILACTFTRNAKKAGVRCAHWRDNAEWWRQRLAGLRETEYYREPPRLTPARQMALFEVVK